MVHVSLYMCRISFGYNSGLRNNLRYQASRPASQPNQLLLTSGPWAPLHMSVFHCKTHVLLNVRVLCSMLHIVRHMCRMFHIALHIVINMRSALHIVRHSCYECMSLNVLHLGIYMNMYTCCALSCIHCVICTHAVPSHV